VAGLADPAAARYVARLRPPARRAPARRRLHADRAGRLSAAAWYYFRLPATSWSRVKDHDNRPGAVRWALTLAALACAVLAGCSASRPKVPPVTATAPPLRPLRIAAVHRPNIVFVLTDDLAWNLVQYMPRVQQMQRDGLTFSNYFVTDSLCCPSRASIFTGRFPHDTGIYTNTAPDGGFNAFHQNGEESQTFPLLLQAAGYRTGLMGKYLNGYDPAALGDRATPYVPPGWNEWDVAGNAYREFNYSLNENGHVVHYGRDASSYMTDVLARKSVRFIDQAAAEGKPFMLEVATFAPHAPFVPAPRDRRDFPGLKAPRTPAFDAPNVDAPSWLTDYMPLRPRSIRRIDRSFRRRAQSVQAVDALIGQVEAELERQHLAGDTYLVFSSDNGLHMGDHRLLPGKLTAFDSDIRVPLIVVGPQVLRGQTVTELAENIDLAPTFLRLAGVSPPPTVDGRSLASLIRGERSPAWRRAVLVEHHGRVTDPNDPDLPTSGAGNPPTYEALRTGNSTYVEYADGEHEFYDLGADPFELHNTFTQLPPSEQASLHAMVTALQNCHDAATCWAAAGGGP
jgi:N-acetylglucosamine-6-sulfatase